MTPFLPDHPAPLLRTTLRLQAGADVFSAHIGQWLATHTGGGCAPSGADCFFTAWCDVAGSRPEATATPKPRRRLGPPGARTRAQPAAGADASAGGAGASSGEAANGGTSSTANETPAALSAAASEWKPNPAADSWTPKARTAGGDTG